MTFKHVAEKTNRYDCPRCEGSGSIPHFGRVIVCPNCDGSGEGDDKEV